MTVKVEHYINRKLIEAGGSFSENEYLAASKLTDLSKLIEEKDKEDNGSKMIVILGEAGSGKSTELYCNSSALYRERDYNKVPIFIPLNTYTGDNFKDYVSLKLGTSAEDLLSYDKSKLIFFLDEFDQVINKESATRNIINFIELYKESMFVISCRSNFYSNQFPGFKCYFLAPFDSADISQFSELELPTIYNQFLARLETLHLQEIVKIPFFLKHLVDIFKKDSDLPDKQTKVLDMVINNSIENDIERLREYDLRNRYQADELRNDLALISIILEILQRNHLHSSEINTILNSEFKSDVIRRLGLIDKTSFNGEEVFRFQHNNFNEYLAARLLSEQDLKKIVDFISIRAPLVDITSNSWIFRLLKYFNLDLYGLKVSDMISDVLKMQRRLRINPSWVNTLGFICQLRPNKDLIDYLIKDEPELALRIEPSRLNDEDKYIIFKSIFDSYLKKKIPIRGEIDFTKLRAIISQSGRKKQDIYVYLMKYAFSNVHQSHRYNSLRLLCYVRGIDDTKIIETLINKIVDADEADSIKNICMYSLVEMMATDRTVIDRIISVSETENDYILSALYYLLFNSADVDTYVDTLLRGICKYKKDKSGEVRLVDERYYLSKCLEKISSPDALKSIINSLYQNPDLFKDYDIKRIMPALVRNLTEAYETDNAIYDSSKQLIISAEKNHIDQLHEIGSFFTNTNTSLRIFKELYDEGFGKHYHAMAVVVNKECLTFLLEKWSEGEVKDNNIWRLISTISFSNRDKYQEAIDFINIKTGNKFVPEPPIDYKSRDRQKLLRKVEIIFNKDEFIKELRNVYSICGKATLSYKEIHNLRYEDIGEVEDKYNDFVLHEIETILVQDVNKEWNEEEIVKIVNSYNYEFFTFEHIFSLLYNGADIELTDAQIGFIENYCKSSLLDRVDFRNALSVERKGKEGNLTTTADGPAVRLWFYKRKYNFRYPERILLDMLSFDWIEQSSYCGIEYLEREIDHEKVKARIKHNLEDGIGIARVLINHVEYCLRNNIYDIVDKISASMDNEYIDNYDKKKIMELLNRFPNGRKYILDYLRSNDKELYVKAAELLLKNNSVDAKDMIRRRIKDTNIDIAVESAKMLIPYQDIDAIKFYVRHFINSKNFEEEMHSPLGRIENIDALKEMEKLLLFFFENQREIEDHHSFFLTEIMQALKNIARKNLRDMRRVAHMMKTFVDRNESAYENVVYLNRYCDEIENEYYTNYKEVSNVHEAIQKVKTFLSSSQP